MCDNIKDMIMTTRAVLSPLAKQDPPKNLTRHLLPVQELPLTVHVFKLRFRAHGLHSHIFGEDHTGNPCTYEIRLPMSKASREGFEHP